MRIRASLRSVLPRPRLPPAVVVPAVALAALDGVLVATLYAIWSGSVPQVFALPAIGGGVILLLQALVGHVCADAACGRLASDERSARDAWRALEGRSLALGTGGILAAASLLPIAVVLGTSVVTLPALVGWYVPISGSDSVTHPVLVVGLLLLGLGTLTVCWRQLAAFVPEDGSESDGRWPAVGSRLGVVASHWPTYLTVQLTRIGLVGIAWLVPLVVLATVGGAADPFGPPGVLFDSFGTLGLYLAIGLPLGVGARAVGLGLVAGARARLVEETAGVSEDDRDDAAGWSGASRRTIRTAALAWLVVASAATGVAAANLTEAGVQAPPDGRLTTDDPAALAEAAHRRTIRRDREVRIRHAVTVTAPSGTQRSGARVRTRVDHDDRQVFLSRNTTRPDETIAGDTYATDGVIAVRGEGYVPGGYPDRPSVRFDRGGWRGETTAGFHEDWGAPSDPDVTSRWRLEPRGSDRVALVATRREQLAEFSRWQGYFPEDPNVTVSEDARIAIVLNRTDGSIASIRARSTTTEPVENGTRRVSEELVVTVETRPVDVERPAALGARHPAELLWDVLWVRPGQ